MFGGNQQQNLTANGDNEEGSSFQNTPPSISLPKGGGAVRGIGEKFAANPVTGTGAMTVPLAASPGRAGFGPQLTLSYDSGTGNGPFGLGWNLSLPAINRKTDKGLPQYHDRAESDEFILSGAEDLVPVLIKEANDKWVREELPTRSLHSKIYRIQRYRPRIESLFARIERWTNAQDPADCFWRSISRDNITTWYGKTEASRIADPNDPARIFSWLICESEDDKGQMMAYDYQAEDSAQINPFQAHERNRTEISRSSNRYIKRIRYGNREPYFPRLSADEPAMPSPSEWLFEVVFDYGEHDLEAPTPAGQRSWKVRPDPFSTYRAGFEVRTYRLCQRVLMFHHFPEEPEVGAHCLVRSTDFTYRYEQSPADTRNPIHSVLTSVTQCGYRRQPEEGYTKKTLPPLEFDYSRAVLGTDIKAVAPDSVENLPYGVDGANYQWADLDGEGLSGVLTEQGGTWFYKRNESPLTHSVEKGIAHYTARLGPVRVAGSLPAGGLSRASHRQFLDLAGDGQVDVVALDRPTAGFYERHPEEGWETFRAFQSVPNLSWEDPNLKFIDLTGDGHADVLITEERAFTWYPSLAEAGFGEAQRVSVPTDEERGPRVVFADGTQTLFLADFSGDGLTDIVRIRNGEVCYWPNLGYGRFGAKVTMDNAPWYDAPDQFDPRRLRLADTDGSGVTDIIYLGRQETRFWFNQSGNVWSAPQVLPGFPPVDNIAAVAAVDLLGNGTACLVWSSPAPGARRAPMKYLNLMAEGKPHLLVRTWNNLGSETNIQYAPSTQFYLADKWAGKPWITRLPFPVHVVEQQIVIDKWRKTRFSTTYSYHHGYFDGEEREFRGFGRVDQIDVESFGEFAAGNTLSPYITEDKQLFQPPVKTVTWFHTGAFRDRAHLLSHYEDEYFPHGFKGETKVLGDFRENPLPEPELATEGLTAEEWREALRACKGMMLRQEIYELEVDALEEGIQRPVKLFSTAYHNCHIRRLQPRAENPHGVFLATESEAITYHYELDLRAETLTPDPRIAHTLNLRLDDYGHVLQSIAVVYPRLGWHRDATLPEGTEELIAQVQGESHLVYTEARYTNEVDEGVNPDQYRLPLPWEVLTYELTGLHPEDEDGGNTPDPRDNRYFTLEELRGLGLSDVYPAEGTPVTDIPYHQVPNRRDPEKRLVEQVRMLYFDENLRNPLPLGKLNHRGLPYETYKLALTEELLDAVFDAKLTPEVRGDLANADVSGYLSGAQLAARFPETDTTGQFWVRSGIAGFADDAAAHFFLPERYTDSFGQTTVLQYDAKDLYLESSTDPLGNTVTVTHFDFHVLAPRAMEDINGNRSEVVFDILGMPTAMAVQGKGSEGDTLDAFTEALINPDLDTRLRFFEEDFDVSEARRWLGGATARHLYDFGEVRHADGTVTYEHRPAGAAGILRERHGAWERESGQESPLQVAFEYSDGMGTVLVKKIQAEPETPGGLLRWIASGKTLLNNKGKPVKQYEPYFSLDEFGQPNHRFEEPQEMGVTPILYYDAVGRTVRAELPDGSLSRVDFSPWQVTNYDPNDTVLEDGNAWYAQRTGPTASPEERRAARIAEKHAGTPATVFLDSLGREVINVAHNRVPDNDPTRGDVPLLDRPWHDKKYLTFTQLDAEGKPLWIRDERGNRVMEYIKMTDPTTGEFVPCYDIAGNLLFQHSMDADDRWMINDSTGQPFYAWDVNDRVTEDGTPVRERRVFHTVYDKLRRPSEQQLQINDGPWQVVERFIYGENQLDDQARNLRGQVYQHHDPSGLMTHQRFDFKGNPLEVTRRLASAYQAPVIDWSQGSTTASLEDETFIQLTEYDALNRRVRLYHWHHGRERVAIYEPHYNERGLLQREDLIMGARRTESGYEGGEPTTAIAGISYNAKGQRTRIQQGNGALTRYDYDPNTFRLKQLRTTRPGYDPRFPGYRSGWRDNSVLQQLSYTYDPVGNITEIDDEAYAPVFFQNQEVKPRSRYIYDALYRLIEAEGREQYSTTGAPPQRPPAAPKVTFPINTPNDPNALRNYTQRYTYDSVGNLMQMRHFANGGSWTRDYAYAEESNRLERTWTGGEEIHAVVYGYDTHGSMLNLKRTPTEYRLRWDYRDMIHHVNLGGGGQAYYNYDTGKQRTRKRIEHNGNTVEERLYLGGMEYYRHWVGGSLVEEIETHHLFADDQRVLIVEEVLRTDNPRLDRGTLYRFQYGNHLGSVALELDAKARVISYEEYHPYGTTAYQANNAAVRATAKRYRYTGMERDEETGLSYHTARYYAPWLGRWTNTDPAGMVDGTNLYAYARSNSLMNADSTGTQCDPTMQSCIDPTASTARKEALQQSLPEDERYLPPASFPQTNPSVRSTARPAGRVISSPTQESGEEEGSNLIVTGVDIGTDFVPLVSNIKDATIAIGGVNPITGESVSVGGRIAAGVFALPGAGNLVKYIGKGGKLIYKGGRKLFGRLGRKIFGNTAKAAKEVAEKAAKQMPGTEFVRIEHLSYAQQLELSRSRLAPERWDPDELMSRLAPGRWIPDGDLIHAPVFESPATTRLLDAFGRESVRAPRLTESLWRIEAFYGGRLSHYGKKIAEIFKHGVTKEGGILFGLEVLSRESKSIKRVIKRIIRRIRR